MIAIVVAFVFGVIGWSFTEYMLHRFAGHVAKGRGELSREHLAHHTDPAYFTPTAKKLLLAVPVLTILSVLGAALAGRWLGIAFAVGFGIGWALYERLHRTLHVSGPRTAYGRWARRHHFHHHFTRPFQNHGVTSPLWDLCFGTYERPAKVRVPRRHAGKLPWLHEPGDAASVRSIHAADYAIV